MPTRLCLPYLLSLALLSGLQAAGHAQRDGGQSRQQTQQNGSRAAATPPAAAPKPLTAEDLNRQLTKLQQAVAVNPANRPLLAFKLEQGRLWQLALQRYSGWEPAEYLTEFQKTLARADAVAKSPGPAFASDNPYLQENAYIAANDGSAQPYWVSLPPNYTPKKKWPLVVYLHGYTPDISKLSPWIPSTEIIDLARKCGYVLVIPYGRRNTDFVQVGQDDLLSVRDRVMEDYSIDPARVFLSGASMGGYGAWAAGLHTAGQWAAVTPVCGRTDFYLWFNLNREEVPPWKRLLYDADDPRFLAENTRHVPVYVQHGAQDFVVPVEHSRRMVRDARRLSLPVAYREDGNGGHYSDFQTAAFEKALAWMATIRKAVPPKTITLVTGDLREATNHWARIEAFQDYGLPARLEVTVRAGNHIEVTGTNVGRFALTPPASVLEPGRLISLTVNGVPDDKLFEATAPLTWEAPNTPAGKSPDRCGPFKNAFRDPFLLVYGDANDQTAAERFRNEWWVYADGWPPVMAASQVTEADKAAFNLVLFGTRRSNPLLRELSPHLPLELTETGYRMGTKQVLARNIGLRMLWKSPWHEKRLVVVQSGLWWGERLAPNHLWDLIPDYLVYGEAVDPTDNSQVALEAGYFDGAWQLPAPPIGR